MQSESLRDKLPKCNWLEKKSRCWLSTGGSGLFEPLVLCCECRPLRRQYPFKLARQMTRVGGGGDPGQEDANLPILFACVLKSLCCPKWPCLNSDLPIARTFANVASQSSSTCGAPSGTSSSPSSKPCKKPFPPRSMWPSSSSLITSGRNRRPTSAAPSSSLRWDRPLVSLLSAPLCSQCIPLSFPVYPMMAKMSGAKSCRFLGHLGLTSYISGMNKRLKKWSQVHNIIIQSYILLMVMCMASVFLTATLQLYQNFLRMYLLI